MNYPKITIVTPNFNGEEYLEETILSVLSQNYPNLEYIIIDGGSSDNSVEIIKKYENQLFYWISEPDKGLYDAIQKGFDKATGDIMGWINSDDVYQKKSFFTVAEIFNNFSDVNWLLGMPTCLDEMGRNVFVNNIRKWSKLDYYLGDFQWIQQESTFWSRKLWEKSGGYIATDIKYAGDLELWLRFFRYEKLFVTHAQLGGFRLRSKNQLSLVFLDQYLEEARGKIKNEIDFCIPEKEKIQLKKIQKYNRIINSTKIKFLRRNLKRIINPRIKKIKEEYFAYPSIIYFDRITQNFYKN
ncbi:glycosyltransferase family 2 protein [Flavobacterium sp.]|uniref:glycosyltransferase family 2 protein n=1 Tax=Flavobacterium sp. TaxID=239 RepID=UPI00286C8B91|nr:glycosyltransferase family 2 protein [Flavobacterium sp.]